MSTPDSDSLTDVGGGDQGRGDENKPFRSPSPQRSTNLLGLGLTPDLTPSRPASVLTTYPHLGHYIYNLLQSIQSSPPRAGNQHPLSVSSSGSDDEGDAGNQDPEQKTPRKAGHGGADAVDRESLVRRVVELLDNEQEEEVKDILKPHMGDLSKDDILMDQVCLDCMHRRRDDLEHLPYAAHPTPARGARGSPSIAVLPLRPYTPTRVPSFRARTPLGRPQSPSGSSSQTPTIPHIPSGLAVSSPSLAPSSGSPIPSPRMLSAKAAMFSPTPRSPSVNLSNFSPSDPWRDAVADPPRSASPFGAVGSPAMTRTSSNLAIAAPLFSDRSSPFHSPIGTPIRGTIKMPDVFTAPSLSVPRSDSRGMIPDDDDDDEFSPFGAGLPKLHHHEQGKLNTEAKAFQPFGTPPVDIQYGSSALSSSLPHSESSHSYDSRGSGDSSSAHDFHADDPTDMGAGMTPLDVLCSVFTSLPRIELEDALHRSGYDFEGAMAILVSQHSLPRSGSSTPQRVSSPRPLLGVVGRAAMPMNHSGPREGYFQQGGRTFSGNMSPGLGGSRSPGGPGTRMCRYYLAGECRRSDCRFSHDLDRALCRFWLRGHCAKGPNCEFLHHFPNNVDPSTLANAMSHVELSSDGSAHRSPSGRLTPQPPDDFPDLLAARLGRSVRFDPSRNRFANAVKRAAPAVVAMPTLHVTGTRLAHNIQQGSYPSGTDSRTTTLAVPRPSQRIKLRPPALLPTLLTGSGANEQYMATRSTALRLGQARNACLARAADAFRRGDGAAAKRFSREGKALNERMLNEAADAAQALVKDRRQDAQKAVRERDASWSDDPGDRAQRGKECAGGLGVIMGVASRRGLPGSEHLSTEERTECLLDLHTLHGSEGADILGQFLAELERESYRGLAYVLVGEEKHVGNQDPLRGASKVRLAASIKQCLAEWGYPWNETGGVLCVDACRY